MSKPSTHPWSRDERGRYLRKLSKHALIEIVLDFADLTYGDADGAYTADDLREFCSPRLELRGDRNPIVGPETGR